MTYSEFQTRDLRLAMLKTLNQQQGRTANEVVLQHEVASYGILRTREAIRTEMQFLASLGAVRVTDAGSVRIAQLLRRGEDHLKGLLVLDAVHEPGLPGE